MTCSEKLNTSPNEPSSTIDVSITMDSPFATLNDTIEGWEVEVDTKPVDPAMEKRKTYFYKHSYMPAPLKNYRSTCVGTQDKTMYSRQAGLLLSRRKRVSFSSPLHKEETKVQKAD